MIYTNKIYPHLIENIKEWPLYKFYNNKSKNKKEVVQIVFDDLVGKYGDNIKDEILKCTYLELKRIKLNPWKVDPPDEKKFWTEIRQLILKSDKCDDLELCHFHLKRIITRYVEEIFGDFKINTYKFARVFLTYLFNRLFNGLFVGSLFNIFWKRKSLENRIQLAGYVEETRELFNRGNVVFLPTHQSNLDSILIGYAIDYKLGLPAFSYGAGLNLFNFELAAFYMARLGAYKVDRRKKNAIYFNSLLAFSMYSIKKNVNSIFFPGGTRSRSGEIEVNLKTGLMGSLLEAQYDKIKENEGKIFIVPVVLNYHSVLEAKSLIYSFLRKSGSKKYMARSKHMIQRSKSINIFKSVYKLFTKQSDFVLSLGKPMDVFGNRLDVNGGSMDALGKRLKIDDYFKREGQLVKDTQRDIVYTKMLAKKIAKSYLNYNVVLSSHIVSYVFYHCLMEKLECEDVFDLMKYKEKEEGIEIHELVKRVSDLIVVLKEKQKEERIILSGEFELPVDELIGEGIKKVGVYHREKVIFQTKAGYVKTENFGLLYYYANRLSFLKNKLN